MATNVTVAMAGTPSAAALDGAFVDRGACVAGAALVVIIDPISLSSAGSTRVKPHASSCTISCPGDRTG